MYEETLARAGLTNDQARIYEILLKNGPLPAGAISKKALLKRGLTYKILDELTNFGLIERRDDAAKILMFSPAHPIRLQELAERKEREAKIAQSAIGAVIGQLTSDFNLISGKPGIIFYEGREGIKKVLDDSLTSKTEICSYADIESIAKYIDDVNKQYVKKRDALKIKKRGIVLDTPFARKYLSGYHKEITETKFIKIGVFGRFKA